MLSVEKAPVKYLEHNSPGTSVDLNKEPPVIPSSCDNVVAPKHAKANRPTRQWAAWTREEEECFFNALRQVGKNFEKITCRVQSKNKDQVRHYYYRLVRRMNKLLGPDLCLDAKNSKDTNAAMLRWWSLLEKYSCKASKLHLKPRRFKIFVEALEHQLMKDRKKNVKKQALQGENHSYPSPSSTNQNMLSVNDAQSVKIVVVDSQNVQKTGQGRGSLTRRSSNISVIRSSNKGESSHPKPTRQRRKSGSISAAALKRWEKAAMAGVSLVADAAEHLECAAVENQTAQQGPPVQEQANSSDLPKNMAIDDNVQAIMKLKLQLFPIDESTRKAMEMDKHNPHLELILSSKKKISSVLEHLDRKWGTSSVASGELMLFPLSIQRANLFAYQRWTRDSVVTAAEVYAVIGSPAVFRLRYGWISRAELQSGCSQIVLVHSIDVDVQENRRKEALREQSFPPTKGDKLEKLADHFLGNHQTSEKQNNFLNESTATCSGEANKNAYVDLSKEVFEMRNIGSSLLSKRNEACDEYTITNMKIVVDNRPRKSPSLSTREWADSLTNATVGDQLTKDIDVMGADGIETPAFRSLQCVEAIPFSCDSFDAAIAAHIYSQNKFGFCGPSPHSSSIWDAEETCDEFSFQNRAIPNNLVSSSTAAAASVSGAVHFRTNSAATDTKVQDSHQEAMDKENVMEDPMDEFPSETHETESSAEDYSSLTDIYWPDSLGPLELDVPSCKYYNEDLILSDSMSGLNRLLASSLDAFQNCPFFGLDEKRPPSPASGTQGGASFTGKICKSENAGVQSLQV